jgi:predicted MarR family transcription regulator
MTAAGGAIAAPAERPRQAGSTGAGMKGESKLKLARARESDWLHSKWPLGGGQHAIQTTEFEWAVMRFFSAFERSCQQLSYTAGAPDTSFQELVVLHVVGMQHHPQGAAVLARQLNRDDVANIQYTLRKLEKKGFIRKSAQVQSKTALYELSDAGWKTVKRYAAIREKLLNAKTELVANIDERLEDAAQLLAILTGIYDDVARTAATYSPYSDGAQEEDDRDLHRE